jgi:hypothetical protein
MFENFDPTRMENGQTPVSRRKALFGLGALAGTAGLLGGAAYPRTSSGGAHARSLNLDFSKADDNLTAWVKLSSSLEDGAETCGYFAGTQYAVIGTQEVIKPLFRIQGFGMSRVTRLPDGRYQNLHREVVYYVDLTEDRIIDSWKNPYTGEEVEVFHTHNDPVNSYYATKFKQRFGTEESGFEEVEFPFILPWQIFGDRAVVSFEVNTRWPTPLPPEKWPREHFGDWYRTSEYFQIHASLADLNNPDLMKVPYSGSWQKVAPWHPWMLMDNREGGILGITSVFSLGSPAELPPQVLAYTEKHYPKYLSAPDKWVEPNMTTWETYARERKPVPARR